MRQQNIGPYFVDFLCRERRLVIEVDGATHSTPKEVAHDARREAYLRDEGYCVLRVSNDDVFRNVDGVCESILAYLASE